MTAFAVVMALISGRARAEAPLAYDLEYVADAECPDRTAFERLVQSQLLESREAALTERARARVLLFRDAERVIARLELERDNGSRYVRELSTDSCDAAAPALAFVLAYALGGGDAESALVPEITTPSSAPYALTRPSNAAVAPLLRPVEPEPSKTPWRFGVAASLGARTGLGPIWTPVESGSVELARETEGPWTLGFRASLLRGVPITRLDRSGSSYFSWLAGRVDACPGKLRFRPWFWALPCLGMHVGRLGAVGEPAFLRGSAGRHADELWLDVAGALRVELLLLRVLTIHAQGDLIVPLTPYRFAFDHPDTSVYQVPGLALAGFVGLAAHFR